MSRGRGIRALRSGRVCLTWLVVAVAVLAGGCRRQVPAEPNVARDVVERDPLKLTVEAAPRNLLVGDPLAVQLAVQAPEGYDVRMPDADALGKPEARQTERVDARPGPAGLIWLRTFVIQPLVSGPLEIPALTVKYREGSPSGASQPALEHELTSGALRVEVRGVLTTQDSPERPRDITGTLLPPAPPPSPWRMGAIAGAIAGVLVAAYVAWRTIRRRALRPPPPLAAEIWALRALEELAGIDWFATGRIREYYYRVTEIIRSYVERKFHLAAPEMTTEEFLSALARDQSAVPYDADRLRDFLAACDAVKYAALQPRQDDAEGVLATARAFVHATAAAATAAAPSVRDKVIK